MEKSDMKIYLYVYDVFVWWLWRSPYCKLKVIFLIEIQFELPSQAKPILFLYLLDFFQSWG